MESSWLDIPPIQNRQFVAQMEPVPNLYKRSYDKTFPLICMDELPKQLIKQTRMPIPSKPGSELKEDFD